MNPAPESGRGPGATDRLRAYYRENPLMVSSPFGGVDGVNTALFRAVIGALGIEVANQKVLDVGCGRGYLEPMIQELGGAYFGADFVVSRAGFRQIVADAQRLPFADGAFDIVLCLDAFEHFPEGGLAAREFRRVLRDGGAVFLSAPNYGNVAGLVKRWCEGIGSYEKNTWAPFRNWQPQELEHFLTGRGVRRIFRSAGFGSCRRRAFGPEVGLGLCPWIDHPGMPEAVKFRLQRLFRWVGPVVAAACPGASLHSFWRFSV